MAIRIPSSSLEQTSICFMPPAAVNTSSWWSSNELESSQSLSKKFTTEALFQSPPCQEMKPLGLELPGDDSYSTQSNFNSQQEVTAFGKTGSQDQCASSGSVHDGSCKRNEEPEIKPNLFIGNAQYPTNCSQSEMAHSNSHTPFGYSDPYFGGLYTAYGPHVLPQMMGVAPARVALPLDLAEDGPIYVNAKQYHGILRRRQIRAKLEAQNKLVKARKPYLHESRHLHAVNRVRGTGGRFLSKKKLQESSSNVAHANSNSSLDSITRDDAHNRVIFQQHDDHQRVSSFSSHIAVSAMHGQNGLSCTKTQQRTPRCPVI